MNPVPEFPLGFGRFGASDRAESASALSRASFPASEESPIELLRSTVQSFDELIGKLRQSVGRSSNESKQTETTPRREPSDLEPRSTRRPASESSDDRLSPTTLSRPTNRSRAESVRPFRYETESSDASKSEPKDAVDRSEPSAVVTEETEHAIESQLGYAIAPVLFNPRQELRAKSPTSDIQETTAAANGIGKQPTANVAAVATAAPIAVSSDSFSEVAPETAAAPVNSTTQPIRSADGISSELLAELAEAAEPATTQTASSLETSPISPADFIGSVAPAEQTPATGSTLTPMQSLEVAVQHLLLDSTKRLSNGPLQSDDSRETDTSSDETAATESTAQPTSLSQELPELRLDAGLDTNGIVPETVAVDIAPKPSELTASKSPSNPESAAATDGSISPELPAQSVQAVDPTSPGNTGFFDQFPGARASFTEGVRSYAATKSDSLKPLGSVLFDSALSIPTGSATHGVFASSFSAGASASPTSAVLDQLAVAVIRTTFDGRVDGVSEVEIELEPNELGKVHLTVTVDGDRVSLRLSASNEATAKMLESQRQDLQSLLKDAGVNCSRCDVFSDLERGSRRSTPDLPARRRPLRIEEEQIESAEFARDHADELVSGINLTV